MNMYSKILEHRAPALSIRAHCWIRRISARILNSLVNCLHPPHEQQNQICRATPNPTETMRENVMDPAGSITSANMFGQLPGRLGHDDLGNGGSHIEVYSVIPSGQSAVRPWFSKALASPAEATKARRCPGQARRCPGQARRCPGQAHRCPG